MMILDFVWSLVSNSRAEGTGGFSWRLNRRSQVSGSLMDLKPSFFLGRFWSFPRNVWRFLQWKWRMPLNHSTQPLRKSWSDFLNGHTLGSTAVAYLVIECWESPINGGFYLGKSSLGHIPAMELISGGFLGTNSRKSWIFGWHKMMVKPP